MNVPVVVGIGLLVAGAVGDVLGVSVLGALVLAVAWLSELWSRRGLRGVTYTRRLDRGRAVWGDAVPLRIGVHNAKLLPLGWLEADDYATDTMTIREQPLIGSERPGLGILRNVWALGPYERVERTVHVEADRRGRFELSRVELSVADLFGRAVATEALDRSSVLVVRPRTVPVRAATASIAPLGTRRAPHGLHEDPALFAGVRPFLPGDERRRIHARASARVGRPVSRRYEPSIARDVVIALDVQTNDGPYWRMTYDDDVMESLAVVAASLARRLLADGAACGLAANGWTYTPSRIGFVAPRPGRDQLARVADILGRLTPIASVPFDDLLAVLPGRLAGGSLVWIVSSRDLAEVARPLRRLRASGFELRAAAVGPRAAANAAVARRLGVQATVARLRPDWRTADAVALAS